MTARRVGLALFWFGAVYFFAASWVAMWWIAPIWQHTPAEQLAGTALAFGGPVFLVISFSAPLGAVLVAIGMLLHSQTAKLQKRPFVVFAAGGTLVALSMLFPPTLGYYPTLFGLAGGVILLSFFAAVWYWAQHRRALEGRARTAADLQLASYVFFLLAASVTCALLGNPFSGLYFPAKVLEVSALPYHYSMGTKVVIYFALGWVFTLLSQRTLCSAADSPDRASGRTS